MTIETLNEDSLSQVIFDNERSLLTMAWKEATKAMLGPHFQGSLYMFAGYALQKKPRKILIDVRKFRFHSPDYDELVGPWRTEHISPLYNKAGVEKFAFLFPPEGESTDAQKWPNENFQTRQFTSENEMRKWLSD